MKIKRLDFLLLFNITLFLLIIINGVFVRGEGQFRESAWVFDKVEHVRCKNDRFSEHTIKLKNNKKNIMILIDKMSCQDLNKLSKYETVSVFVDYGYGPAEYSSRIKTEDNNFIGRGNKDHLYDGKYLNGFERLILLVLVIYFITRFFKYLRETKLS
ncbi:hypothetical protein [Pseudoalteromonas denitrificans]|nr:hypothetical protein [Pseudoalteromonas denitrificans]